MSSKLQDLAKLEANIKARGLDTNCAAIIANWELFKSLDDTRRSLENKRDSITNEIKEMKRNGKEKEDYENLIIQGRMIRGDLKALMKPFWQIEETLMLAILALPNRLNPDTPLDQERIIEEIGKPSISSEQGNHLDLGKNIIDIRIPEMYYLRGRAAKFDFLALSYFSDILKESGFIKMVPPDFVHAAVVEGCGSWFGEPISIHDEECESVKNQLFVVGGASIYPFCSYYTDKVVSGKSLPVRHQVAGKRYNSRKGHGLFGVWQRSCVDIFILDKDPQNLRLEFDKTVNVLCQLYKNLNWHVRVSYVPAKELRNSESLRVSFQMKSISLKKWVEIGHLSLTGDYISERLLIGLQNHDDTNFCQIIYGTAIDVTTVLACLIEQGGELISKELQSNALHEPVSRS